MKKIIVILILMLSTYIHSQELKEKKWVLKLNTTQLIDVLSFPTLQISSERKINNYFSINTEIGFQIFDLQKNDTIFLNPKGLKINVEGRFYLSKLLHPSSSTKNNGLFCGLQVFYRKNKEVSSILFTKKNEVELSTVENFAVKKNDYGLNLTSGYQISNKNFILEPYIGIGIVKKNIQKVNIKYNDSRDDIEDFSVKSFFGGNKVGNSSSFNLTFGLRLGYKL